MMIKRTKAEIDELMSSVMSQVDEGGSRFPGMTYEQGIGYAIMWLTGDTDDHPYEDES